MTSPQEKEQPTPQPTPLDKDKILAAIEAYRVHSGRNIYTSCGKIGFQTCGPSMTSTPTSNARCDICLKKTKSYSKNDGNRGPNEYPSELAVSHVTQKLYAKKSAYGKAYVSHNECPTCKVCQECATKYFEHGSTCCFCEKHWLLEKPTPGFSRSRSTARAGGKEFFACDKCCKYRALRECISEDEDEDDAEEKKTPGVHDISKHIAEIIRGEAETRLFSHSCCVCGDSFKVAAFAIHGCGPSVCVDCLLARTPGEIEGVVTREEREEIKRATKEWKKQRGAETLEAEAKRKRAEGDLRALFELHTKPDIKDFECHSIEAKDARTRLDESLKVLTGCLSEVHRARPVVKWVPRTYSLKRERENEDSSGDEDPSGDSEDAGKRKKIDE